MIDSLFEIENLQNFYTQYSNSCKLILDLMDIDSEELIPDHLGCLLHNPEEFDDITHILSSYSKQIREVTLSNRRVRVFKFTQSLQGSFPISKIEIFEPKPQLDIRKLRFGIEHISFFVKDWDMFYSEYRDTLPIAKEGSVNNSLFMKAEIINTIEIEFRNDKLGEETL